MPQVILVSGKKRAGKDHITSLLAKSLTNLGKSVDIQPFAKPLKQLAAVTLGISEDELEEFKNNPKEFTLTINNYGNVEHLTNCRELLQRLGTEAVKPIFGNDVWVNLLKQYVANSTADYVLVPDFRFPVEYINHAITVRVECNLTDQSDTHESEVALDDYAFHHILNNDDYQLTESDVFEFAKQLLPQGYNNKHLMKKELINAT